MRRFIASLGFLVVAAVTVGCASNKYPRAPESAASSDYSYIIGAGDTLNIIVWRNPELSMVVPVRPDGKISTPLVDEMVAQGKNSIEVAREIETVLGKLVRDPVVTVIVTSFVGPYSEQITAEGGKQYSVRLRDLVKRGDISQNVEMKPGDILIIPQSWF